MLTLASCVAEPLADCPPDVRLYMMTDHEMGYYGSRTADIEEWYSSMDTVAVYVFDENERYVTVWHGGRYTPGEEFEIPLIEMNLREGVYTFVAWTNQGDEYLSNLEDLEARRETTGEEFYLDDMRMTMSLPGEGGAIEDDLRHRHHGILERAYVSNNSILSPGPNIIAMMPSLHRVNISVTGVSPNTKATDHTLTVTDSNWEHDFHSLNVPELDTYSHRRPFAPVGDESNDTRTGTDTGTDTRAEPPVAMAASIYLMQLHDDTVTSFEIHHNSEDTTTSIHREEDLVQLINDAYGFNRRGVDFNEVLEFDISIDVSSKLQTVFYINGWQYIRHNVRP